MLINAIDNTNLSKLDILLKAATPHDLKKRICIVRDAGDANNQRNVINRGNVRWDIYDRYMTTEPRCLYLNVLQYAALSGKTTMVRHILDRCTFPSSYIKETNQSGVTVLMAALLSKHIHAKRMVSFLVSKGAPTKGSLHFAAARGDMDIIDVIIREGVNANERDFRYKRTPLFFASTPAVVDKLLRRGANVNAKDADNFTPIMSQLDVYDPDYRLTNTIPVVNRLLDKGANVKLTGKQGYGNSEEKGITLLHIASAHACDQTNATKRDYETLYTRIAALFPSKNKKTSMNNTPLLYALKFNKSLPLFRSTRERTDSLLFGMKLLLGPGGANPSARDSNNRSAAYILRSIHSINIDTITTQFPMLASSRNLNSSMSNVRLPNNLNLMDPITMNNVQLNNAYILTTDLHGKRNANTNRNIREIKTVYNKSTLNQLINSTLRRGARLVSPITRKPFTPHNIVKLVEIVPVNELSRFRNARRGTPSNNNSRRNS